MLQNYFKIAWRSLVKNSVFSGINILGLAAGMSVAMLIGLWIWDEVSFNNYHVNHHELAQIMSTSYNEKNEAGTGSAVAMPLGDELREKYANDFTSISMASWNYEHGINIGEKRVNAKGMWVEADFPSMFSLKILKGNSRVLDDPSSVLLSESIAKVLFGDTNPIDQVLQFDNKDHFKVAGVFEDLPSNTTFSSVQILLPWKKYISSENWLKEAKTQWNNHSFQAFAQINKNETIERVSDKIKGVAMAHKNAATEGKEVLLLHPMDKWRLYSDFRNGEATGGRIRFVWLFAIIGVFILLLACINFMNLSTARSEKRAKEVGIRKAIGSHKTQLIGQFLSESVLVALVSFILSVLFVLALMPVFNTLADKKIHFPWGNLLFWVLAIVFTVVTGLMAGVYPAFYLSTFEPIKVLKGTFRAGRFASLPRKVLVVIQFSFSIALIIGTIVVFKQIQYAKDRPVNYRNEGLITIRMSTPDLFGHYDAVRSDLLATGVVDNMAESSSATTRVASNNIGFNWQGKNPNSLPGFGTIYVTKDFGNTIGWQIKEGRDFSKELTTDTLAVILNEAAVNQIGMNENIVGKAIQYRQTNYQVVGVIKDIIMESPYNPVRPTIFFNNLRFCNTITISIKQGTLLQHSLNSIAAVFKKYNAPFDYAFNDEVHAKKFVDEQRIGNLATFFSLLAIFISCLGLFGLASYVAEQRKKEIGVRKVLGASVVDLWQMLLKEFTLLVAISCGIAIPLAWYYLYEWLQQYSYKTTISWWIFIVSGAGVLLITVITVSFQAIKAALANPIKSLRAE